MKQSEIWSINLDPTVGAEMKKSRPALIINVDSLGKLPLKIIAPITDWKDHYKDNRNIVSKKDYRIKTPCYSVVISPLVFLRAFVIFV